MIILAKYTPLKRKAQGNSLWNKQNVFSPVAVLHFIQMSNSHRGFCFKDLGPFKKQRNGGQFLYLHGFIAHSTLLALRSEIRLTFHINLFPSSLKKLISLTLPRDISTFYKKKKATSYPEDTFKIQKYYQRSNIRVREDREDRHFFFCS